MARVMLPFRVLFVLQRDLNNYSGHSISRSEWLEKLNDPIALRKIIQTLRYRIPIDPRQPLVTVSIRSDGPNVAGGRGCHTIEPASETGIRTGDAAPVCSVPVLGLPVIPNRPDVIGGDGSHRKQIFIDVSRIRYPTPAASVPVIGQRRISVAREITPL